MNLDLNNLQIEMTYCRRELHKIPEPGFKEFKTLSFLESKLKEYGYEPVKIAETGLYVYIDGEQEDGVAFRADMDALEIEEKNDVSYSSEHKGRMHACGHDGHMSILLRFAKYLSTFGKPKKGILLVFQPAEEGPGGAKDIVESGIFEKYNIKAIFGLHLFPNLDQGTIGCKRGPLMAKTAELDFKIIGKSAHGAMPHTGIDAIYVASKLVEAYQGIIGRSLSPVEGSVITIGKIRGGDVRNIIAQDVILEGTVRTFSNEVYNTIIKRIKDINRGMELAYGVEIKEDIRPLYPPVVNDGKLYEHFKAAIEGKSNFIEMEPLMLAEDFSYYQEAVPGIFFMLGTRTDEFCYPLHNSRFNFDEVVLKEGLKVFIEVSKEMGAI
jgi:hippurate hydrolase